MLDRLVGLVVPPRCAACRAPGRHAADVLCGACRRALPWLVMQACCERCALPLPHVARCPARDAPFDAAWSAVAYEGTARHAMHALKFSAARPLAEVMAAQIAANAPPELLPPAWTEDSTGACAARGLHGARAAQAADLALVAVPAHPARRRERGFDPAELLARALARKTGLPLAKALRRGAAPSRQLGADRETRRAAGAAGLRSPRAGAAQRDPRRRRPYDGRHAGRLRARAQAGRSAARRRADMGAHALAAGAFALAGWAY